MHVAITNRLGAKLAAPLIKTPHAIISITDPDKELVSFAPNENRIETLSLQFYDLADIKDELSPQDAVECVAIFRDGLFSDEQAVQIVDFVERVKDRVKGILVHCEAGVSRSAAVAAVIERMLNGSNERVFSDPRYSPNQYVYQRLLKIWQQSGRPRSGIEGQTRDQARNEKRVAAQNVNNASQISPRGTEG